MLPEHTRSIDSGDLGRARCCNEHRPADSLGLQTLSLSCLLNPWCIDKVMYTTHMMNKEQRRAFQFMHPKHFCLYF